MTDRNAETAGGRTGRNRADVDHESPNTREQRGLRSSSQPVDESGHPKDDPARAPESGTP